MGKAIRAVVSLVATAAASIFTGGLGASLGALLAKAAISTVISVAFNAAAGAIFGRESSNISQGRQPAFTSEARERKQIIRSSIAPRRVVYGQARVSGPLVNAASSGSDNRFLHLVIPLCAHEVEEIGDVYLNDELSTSARFSGKVRIKKHLGASDQVADSDLVNEVSDWTNAHRLRGIAYLYVRLDFDRDAFPTGVPNISAIVKGKKVYDPRTDTTAWSDNAALCIRDYLMADHGIRADIEEVHEGQLIETANICDESVGTPDGVQPRYTLNGVIFLDSQPIDVIEKMLTSMGGALVYTQGQYKIFAAAYRAPVLELNEDFLRGPIKVRPQVPESDLFNTVRGTYVNPDEFWEADDLPQVTNQDYIEEDGGEEYVRDISLPFTTDSYMGERLENIHLKKSRQGITIDMPCNLMALDVEVWSPVYLSIAELGWDQKVFVPIKYKFSADGGIDLVLQEEDASCYAWSAGDATVRDPAPNTNLPSPYDPPPPSGLVLVSGDDELYQAGDGTIITRLKASWSAPEDATVLYYDFEYKREGEANFKAIQIPAGINEHYLDPVQDGSVYFIRIRQVNIRLVPSQYLEGSHQVQGKSARPAPVDQFGVSRLADGTRRFSFLMLNIPPDVRTGGGFKILFNSGNEFDLETAEQLNNGLLTSSPYETNDLPAGTYTFGIVTVDSSGNESESIPVITATLGDPRLKNVLYQRIETSFNWPGTLTDCFVNTDNKLEATAAQDWDDMPGTWDGLPDTWNEIVDSNSPIVYEMPVIDLGADVNFSPLVTVDSNGSSTVEIKTGNTSDGDVVGAYIPAAPVNSVRYIQIKVTVSASHPLITNITTLLDGESVVDEINDLDLSTNTEEWFELIATGHFKLETRKNMSVITQASIVAMQNVGSGFTWEVVDKNTTLTGRTNPAAEFKVYNSANVLTNAVLDIQLKGPKST